MRNKLVLKVAKKQVETRFSNAVDEEHQKFGNFTFNPENPGQLCPSVLAFMQAGGPEKCFPKKWLKLYAKYNPITLIRAEGMLHNETFFLAKLSSSFRERIQNLKNL